MQQDVCCFWALPPRCPSRYPAYAEPAGISYHAARLAAGFRLGAADRDDIRQELRLALLQREHRFDPQRSAHATFASLVLRHAVQDLSDRLARERRNRFLPLDAAMTNITADVVADIDLRIALERFATTLSDELLHVWRLLAIASPAEAIRAFGRSRAGFYRSVRELRLRALAAGLGDVPPAETVRHSRRYITGQNIHAATGDAQA